ncbi:MAG: hypothetical protein WCB74_02155, partial [Pseudolabrys sp.]
CRDSLTMSVHRGKADILPQGRDFRFDPLRSFACKSLAVRIGQAMDFNAASSLSASLAQTLDQ